MQFLFLVLNRFLLLMLDVTVVGKSLDTTQFTGVVLPFVVSRPNRECWLYTSSATGQFRVGRSPTVRAGQPQAHCSPCICCTSSVPALRRQPTRGQ